MPPGAERVAPALDREGPLALGRGVVRDAQLGVPPVGAGCAGRHPQERLPLPAGVEHDDVGADGVVALPEHGRRDDDGLPRDGACGVLRARHRRADRCDCYPSHHCGDRTHDREAGTSSDRPVAAVAATTVARVRALRRFTVRLALPEPLAPLAELVMNLRWSWHPQSLDLFRSVDPQVWDAVGQDPVRLLGEVSPERLAQLAADPVFLAELAAAHTDLQDYLSTPRWYQGLSGRALVDRVLLARSSASPRCCRSTPAASASWPATTSRRPPTWACRSSASGCSTGPATSSSRSTPRAGSRSATPRWTRTACRSRS